MSNLLEYLKNIDVSNIAEHFQEKFGVVVKKEGDLYLFKYSQISANWNEAVTRECRGHILKLDENGWRFMSRPWDKFFNQPQSQCPVFEEEEFNKRLRNFQLMEKADGTCIQMWHDDEKWRISTLGMISTGQVQDMDITFEDLFRRTVNLDTVLQNWGSELDTNKTYLFELCCDENRIVTKYEKDKAFLLGVRDRNTGDYQYVEDAFPFINTTLPFLYDVKDLAVNSLQDVLSFVEKESSKAGLYGEYPEGFVIYENSVPIAKIKNVLYMSLHSIGGGDIKHSMNQCVDAIFNSKIDDLYPFLSTRLVNFVEEVRSKINLLTQSAMDVINDAGGLSFDTRKDFALFVMRAADKRITPFFFENAERIMAGNSPGVEDFEMWLEKNYSKFDWKS